MEPWKWIVLGVMIALTPSLIVLGLLLLRAQDDDHDGPATGT